VLAIQYVDHFGNLVTNILAAYVQGLTWSIVADGLTIPGVKPDQPAFHAIALIGSHGWVEIAINGGNAQSQLQLDWGARVELMCTQTKEVNDDAASSI